MYCCNCGNALKDGECNCGAAANAVNQETSTILNETQTVSQNADIQSSNQPPIKYHFGNSGSLNNEQQSPPSPPPQYYQQGQHNYYHQSQPQVGGKSRVAAGLLAIFIAYGVYSFYLGNIGKGIVQLCLWLFVPVLFIIGFFFFPLLIIAFLLWSGLYLWDLIDGIRILCGAVKTDGRGNPLI